MGMRMMRIRMRKRRRNRMITMRRNDDDEEEDDEDIFDMMLRTMKVMTNHYVVCIVDWVHRFSSQISRNCWPKRSKKIKTRYPGLDHNNDAFTKNNPGIQPQNSRASSP